MSYYGNGIYSSTTIKNTNSIISFSNLDFKGTDQNLHDPIVISIVAGNYIDRKVLVNHGSSADILYASTLQKMQILESSLSPCNGDLVGFSRKQFNVLGVIKLRTTFETEPNIKTTVVQYLVIDSQALYHMILGRPSLNTLEAMVSTPYLAQKFLILATEVGVVFANQKEARHSITSH